MPKVTVTANIKDFSIDPKLPITFEWKVSLVFNGVNCVHSLGRLIKHDEICATTSSNRWVIPFKQLRGGDLSVAVTATTGKTTIKAKSEKLQVIGTNPGLAALASSVPANSAFRKLMRIESKLRQFLGATCPYFSEDDFGGVGICQVTNPSPSDDEVWSWKENVKAGWRLYKSKESIARAHPSAVRKGENFKTLVANFNADRQKQNAALASKPGAPKPAEIKNIRIDLPDYTEEQLEQDTIRSYNGYSGGWHEFRVKTDKKTGLLVVNLGASGDSGTAEWEQISAADRIAHLLQLGVAKENWGDPDYVNKVEAAESF